MQLALEQSNEKRQRTAALQNLAESRAALVHPARLPLATSPLGPERDRTFTTDAESIAAVSRSAGSDPALPLSLTCESLSFYTSAAVAAMQSPGPVPL